jgi:RNA polymerase sigma factor (sigma-70 family)
MAKRWLHELTFSEETSLSLLSRAQGGDDVAMEALVGRYLPRLQRWASGRLPKHGRRLIDTDDLVQDALLNTFRRLDEFRPRHDGALMAYLREAVANRIRMELRRPAPETSSFEPDLLPSDADSPLQSVLDREALARYERALAALDEDDRAAIVSRFEMGLSYEALARAMNRPSAEAARKLADRALRRLVTLMQPQGV